MVVIIISCFVKCRIPESQASRLKRLQEKQRRRRDEVDRSVGRAVPQHQSRPHDSHQPHRDPHHVEIELRQLPNYPSPSGNYTHHVKQYNDYRRTESGYYQPHSPRHSAQPYNYDYRQSRQ